MYSPDIGCLVGSFARTSIKVRDCGVSEAYTDVNSASLWLPQYSWLQRDRFLPAHLALLIHAERSRWLYESPSQFNREYNRMFGVPPLRDVTKLRQM